MRTIVLAALAVLTLFGCVANRNVPLPYSIAGSLALPEYKDRLEGVAFYFGDQPHPAVEKTFNLASTSQRSNAVNHAADAACARAFVSALLRLRAKALSIGADAVINIKSNYKFNEVSSPKQYQCATGVIMSGVALKGTPVRLKK